MLATGLVLLLAAGVLALVEAHLASLKAWDRPRIALGPAYGIAAKPARWLVLAASLVCLGRASFPALIAAALLLVAIFGWLAWVRSPSHALRRMRRDLTLLEAGQPGAPRKELVGRILSAWHPEWSPEVIQQMVEAHPALEDLTRFVARMERGWPS